MWKNYHFILRCTLLGKPRINLDHLGSDVHASLRTRPLSDWECSHCSKDRSHYLVLSSLTPLLLSYHSEFLRITSARWFRFIYAKTTMDKVKKKRKFLRVLHDLINSTVFSWDAAYKKIKRKQHDNVLPTWGGLHCRRIVTIQVGHRR